MTEFAEVLGIDHSLLSRYLRGESSPSRRTVRRIAASLGAAPGEIEALVPDLSTPITAGRRAGLDVMIGGLAKEVSQLRRVLTVGRRVEELGVDLGIARYGTPTIREVEVDEIEEENAILASLRVLGRERYSEDRVAAKLSLLLVTVSGSCQRPYIEPGDRVFTRPGTEYERGDLVAVLYNGQMCRASRSPSSVASRSPRP